MSAFWPLFAQQALHYRTFTLIVIGLVLGALALLISKRARHDLRVAQVLLRWFLLCAVGVGFLGVSLQHLLPHTTPDPAGFQIGLAAAGFAAVGVASAWGGIGMRLAALLGPTAWIVGALLAQRRTRSACSGPVICSCRWSASPCWSGSSARSDTAAYLPVRGFDQYPPKSSLRPALPQRVREPLGAARRGSQPSPPRKPRCARLSPQGGENPLGRPGGVL
ncbi:membrane hypothetical protein [Thiomonas sp. CB3]|nr:membrane hypothetical protein [Thiomonas sp. CB3]